jgi:hypothetical protein
MIPVVEREEKPLIVLGVVLLILGLVFNAGILWTIGLILIGVGVILAVLGLLDRAIGPRSHYY